MNINVRFKMDCYQPAGSFKIRGMETLCRYHISQGRRDFIASSGGNAGYSLAYVCKILNATVKIMVPESTPSFMLHKMRQLGAEVEVYGKLWNDTDVYTRAQAIKEDRTYISPFDHVEMWKGHSSIIDECAKEMSKPDKVVVAVGGGGLLNGVYRGLKRNSWNDVEVVCAETEGAASFKAGFDAKEVVILDKVDTIASSLGSNKVLQEVLDISTIQPTSTHICTDLQALNACEEFYKEFNVLVEPACGAAISYPYLNYKNLSPDENILVIICGGIGMNFEKYLEYKQLLEG